VRIYFAQNLWKIRKFTSLIQFEHERCTIGVAREIDDGGFPLLNHRLHYVYATEQEQVMFAHPFRVFRSYAFDPIAVATNGLPESQVEGRRRWTCVEGGKLTSGYAIHERLPNGVVQEVLVDTIQLVKILNGSNLAGSEERDAVCFVAASEQQQSGQRWRLWCVERRAFVRFDNRRRRGGVRGGRIIKR
jgi:hypothetical protein